MFHNLIFDWSGTLVDDLPPVLEATNHVLGIYGVAALDREGFRLRFRLPYRDFYEELLPGVPLDELEVHFRRAFAASCASWDWPIFSRRPIPGCSTSASGSSASSRPTA
jgi:phosphoglycolate phosphatase